MSEFQKKLQISQKRFLNKEDIETTIFGYRHLNQYICVFTSVIKKSFNIN